MIPKVIHYCWFSGEKKPKLIRKCLKSWKKIMPDYQIKCWDGDSFDFSSVPYVEQAIKARRWAFAADYIRLYALYTEGGIYLDTDVEVFKRFDDFLNYSFFSGTDTCKDSSCFLVEAGIMGAEKNNEYIHECMAYYESRNFILPDGSHDLTIIPIVLAEKLKPYGYLLEDKTQKVQTNAIIYSTEYFTNSNSVLFRDINYAHHYNNNAWFFTNRGKFCKFCKKHDLMRLYHFIESIRIYIKYN